MGIKQANLHQQITCVTSASTLFFIKRCALYCRGMETELSSCEMREQKGNSFEEHILNSHRSQWRISALFYCLQKSIFNYRDGE